MTLRSLMIPALVLVACGCSEESAGSRSEPARAAQETVAADPTPAAPEETVEAAEPEGVHEAAGLRVQVHDDGTVTVTGDDRWGTHVDTTFADAEYFRNALEVLERNFTSEQAVALQAALAELPAAEEPAEDSPEEEP